MKQAREDARHTRTLLASCPAAHSPSCLVPPPPSLALLPLRSHMPAVTQCSTEELKPLLRALLALQHAAARATDYSCPYLAVRDKYRSHVWFCVSTTTPFDRLPLALLEAASAAGR